MTVYETDLPGVGKKHEIELEDGSTLVIVTEHSGRREVFRRPDADADAEKLFELSDGLARTVGTVLEGAYFQPVPTEDIGTILGENTRLEWSTADANSPVAGRTLTDVDVRGRTGATVIAIQRGDVTISNPGADTAVRAGDTLIALGTREQARAFDELITGSEGATSEGRSEDESADP